MTEPASSSGIPPRQVQFAPPLSKHEIGMVLGRPATGTCQGCTLWINDRLK
jgi:hypothetical protein